MYLKNVVSYEIRKLRLSLGEATPINFEHDLEALKLESYIQLHKRSKQNMTKYTRSRVLWSHA